MANLVTERFVRCVEHLRENNIIKSIRQFALALDVHPQNVNDVFKGKRDVTIDLIQSAVSTFNINPAYIFTGDGHFLRNEEVDRVPAQKQLERIVYVPMAAHAGYAEQFQDPVFLEDLVNFSLPDYKFQHGTYRCFDVVGDSMEPSLYAGDKVVCSQVDTQRLSTSLRGQHVYVIVMTDGVVVKRIINHAKSELLLNLVSDNEYYRPFEVSTRDIKEIWYVEVKISPFLPSPHNIRQVFHSEMDMLKTTIESQSKSIQLLNQTVEKLLKANRSLV